MISIIRQPIAIQIFSSILMLMALFASTAYAVPCHGYGQATFQTNQGYVIAQDISDTFVAIEVNVIQYNAYQCCTVICSTLCESHNIPVGPLLISSSFENKQAVDIPKTNRHNDADLEDIQANLKLQTYYQISHSVTSSLLQTTLKHRILLI